MSNPSLLCVPYRFKTSKLYSQIPDSGLGDFTVTRSASNAATRVNAAGLIETVADNVPRLDYPLGGITAGCPALLVEPSAVNYFLRSQEFDNASWGKNVSGINTGIGTSGIEANVAVSPDGTQNADRVNFLLQTDVDLGLNQNYAAATSGQVYNTSIWFKGEGANIGKQIKVQMKRTTGGVFVGTTATITLTSGWVRFASSAITLGASNSGVIVVVSSNDATNALIWGAQLEQGSVATSYIPTTTAAVTRNADVISVSGAVSGSIGQTQGTIYVEFEHTSNTAERRLIALSDGTATNRCFIWAQNNILYMQIRGSDKIIVNPIPTGYNKVAFAYEQNGASGNMYASLNGGAIVSGTSSDYFTADLNRVAIGNRESITAGLQWNNRIRAAALYTTRLTNAQLQALTT
jgi:hypothetical protein